MHVEYYQMLVHLFETTQFDNMKINRGMIYIKDDLLPLEVGTTHTRVRSNFTSFNLKERLCFFLC